MPGGIPGARGRRSVAELRDVGPDLQAVRLASDVHVQVVAQLEPSLARSLIIGDVDYVGYAHVLNPAGADHDVVVRQF
jgi:hypothetical protein